jgi:ribonuclease P protein component
MGSPRKHTFPRAERLKSRKQIEALFRSGKTFSLVPFRVFYRWERLETKEPAQIAIGATKRHFKRAVDRNRIKRLVREGYRLQKDILQHSPAADGLRVFIVYTGTTLPEFAVVMEKMRLILMKLSEMTPNP